MSILDDAIREHLELKRAHGADDAELKKLEDEAFGPPERPDEPDPFAEAPTEFLDGSRGRGRGGSRRTRRAQRRAPNIADLQEAPPSRRRRSPPRSRRPRRSRRPPRRSTRRWSTRSIADAGHSTEERHAIAEQPTELFDVEGEFDDAGAETDAPSDEELVDAELAEPRLAPVDPLAGIEAGAEAELEVSDRRRGRRRGRRGRLLQRAAALRRAQPGARGARCRTSPGAPAHRGSRAIADVDDDELDGGRGRPRTKAPTSRRGGGLRRARRRGGRGADSTRSDAERRRPRQRPRTPAPQPRREPPTRTCSRTRRTSSRTPPRTTTSGSSRSPRRTSTSTISPSRAPSTQ